MATRVMRDLEYLTYEERQRQMGGFKPKWRRLNEDQLLFEVTSKLNYSMNL